MGYFDIIEEMIFIDKGGRVKVWANPDISRSHPYMICNRNVRDFYGSQADMITNLINLIEENTDVLG